MSISTPKNENHQAQLSVTGVILAGGKSQRMGTNKALLSHAGQSLLQRAIATLRGVHLEQLLISGPDKNTDAWQQLTEFVASEPSAQDLKPSAPQFEHSVTESANSQDNITLELVADQYAELGPLGGIYSCMLASRCPWLLITPVDMPNLQHTTLKHLLQVAQKTQTSVQFEHQPLPLLLKNNEINREILLRVLTEKSRLSIRHFLSQTELYQLPEQYLDDWVNLNTPEQWREFTAKP